MEYDTHMLKSKAQEFVRGAKPSPIYSGMIYLAIALIFAFINSKLSVTIDETTMKRLTDLYSQGDYEYVAKYIASLDTPPAYKLISFLTSIVLSVVKVGYIIFILNTLRSAAPCYGNLLDGFAMFLRLLLLFILTWIFIFLWSLLLIVPGIIASYRYRMAIYLLIDHPEMSVMDCIRESKRMMKGHKGELFMLDLSFIGWGILNVIPYLGYAVQIYTLPYFSFTYAMYYEQLAGHAIGSPADNSDRKSTPPWEDNDRF